MSFYHNPLHGLSAATNTSGTHEVLRKSPADRLSDGVSEPMQNSAGLKSKFLALKYSASSLMLIDLKIKQHLSGVLQSSCYCLKSSDFLWSYSLKIVLYNHCFKTIDANRVFQRALGCICMLITPRQISISIFISALNRMTSEMVWFLPVELTVSDGKFRLFLQSANWVEAYANHCVEVGRDVKSNTMPHLFLTGIWFHWDPQHSIVSLKFLTILLYCASLVLYFMFFNHSPIFWVNLATKRRLRCKLFQYTR